MDDHQCNTVEVKKRISQGLLVSAILFAIYISGIFKEVEEKVEIWMTTSFADDCACLMAADSVTKLCMRLKRAGLKPVEWRDGNHFTFDNSKDKMNDFL